MITYKVEGLSIEIHYKGASTSLTELFHALYVLFGALSFDVIYEYPEPYAPDNTVYTLVFNESIKLNAFIAILIIVMGEMK